MVADAHFPSLLETIAIVSLAVALVCAIWIARDCWRPVQVVAARVRAEGVPTV